MGKCDNCGKKILYNKFKRYRGTVLCYECYDTRLERKRAKKEAAKKKLEQEDIAKVAKDYGLSDEKLDEAKIKLD